MYGMMGERRLARMGGALAARLCRARTPVRVGNAAYQSVQLDVFGEVMDALHHGRAGNLGQDDAGGICSWNCSEHLETIWREPDHGIWEVRGAPPALHPRPK